LDNTNCQAHYSLGKIYNDLGRYNDAIKSLTLASTGTCVRNRSAIVSLAEAHYNAGNRAQAKATWERILRLFSGEKVAELASEKLRSLKF
jgi:TolA-binding protein